MTMPQEIQLDGYLISDDPARLDLAAIHAYLTRSYWAPGIPLNIVERSVRNSLCLGLYVSDGSQVGLARVVTDYATFAWLCDIYVLEGHRRKGLGKALVRAVLARIFHSLRCCSGGSSACDRGVGGTAGYAG